MTPKEKADEIYTKCDLVLKAPFKSHIILKNLSIIVVDELIKESHDMFEYQRFTFWNQVRNEIVQL